MPTILSGSAASVANTCTAFSTCTEFCNSENCVLKALQADGEGGGGGGGEGEGATEGGDDAAAEAQADAAARGLGGEKGGEDLGGESVGNGLSVVGHGDFDAFVVAHARVYFHFRRTGLHGVFHNIDKHLVEHRLVGVEHGVGRKHRYAEIDRRGIFCGGYQRRNTFDKGLDVEHLGLRSRYHGEAAEIAHEIHQGAAARRHHFEPAAQVVVGQVA